MKVRQCILQELFNETNGLINSKTSVLPALQKCYDKWDNIEAKTCLDKQKSFTQWFKKYQETRFIKKSLHDVNKLGLQKVFRNNRQEAIHNAIKSFLEKNVMLMNS